MKYQKFNKYEKKEVRRAAIQAAMSGGGTYLYQNSSAKAELTLPRPTHSGVRKVGAGQQFQGDDYYMQMVKTGDLRLVEILQTAVQEQAAKELPVEQKLILEQPDTVTTEGIVERVSQPPAKKKKPLRESENKKQEPDVLLNESLV